MSQKTLEQKQQAKVAIDLATSWVFSSCKEEPEAFSAFSCLIVILRQRSHLLKPVYGNNHFLGQENCEVIRNLLPVVLHCKDWQAPIEKWIPERRNFVELYASLVNYLFKDYSVSYFKRIGKGFALCKDPRQVSALFSLVNSFAKSFNSLSERLLETLHTISFHCEDWISPATTWVCPLGESELNTIYSLVEHLFARYPVPDFMQSVWLKGLSNKAICQQNWFKHIGAGQNIRTANIPLHLTKKMAHYFMQAPAGFSIERALRWSQVLGMGGSKDLANRIIYTDLGEEFANETFWKTVIYFFINHPKLPGNQIRPIVDYLKNIKSMGLPFSIKGQTVGSILKRIESWHRHLTIKRSSQKQWKKSGFSEFRYTENKKDPTKRQLWQIQELLSSDDLFFEGRAMRHCVASYASLCLNGCSSIWSMTIQDATMSQKRVLTIEVDNQKRTICQVRKKYNRAVDEKSMEILQLWAHCAKLNIEMYL